MAVKADQDVRRITVVRGKDGGRQVYRFRDEDVEDRNPIKRVTLIKRDRQGRLVSREAFEGERPRKRSSRGLRPLERGVRDLLEFQADVIQNYLGRHRHSNERHRDGWLADMPTNVIRAVRRSRPRRLFRVSNYRSDRD